MYLYDIDDWFMKFLHRKNANLLGEQLRQSFWYIFVHKFWNLVGNKIAINTTTNTGVKRILNILYYFFSIISRQKNKTKHRLEINCHVFNHESIRLIHEVSASYNYKQCQFAWNSDNHSGPFSYKFTNALWDGRGDIAMHKPNYKWGGGYPTWPLHKLQ